jgi:serine/threonine protein kinase
MKLATPAAGAALSVADGDPAIDWTLRRAEKRVGTILRDKWRLDRLLGLGGMAAVYAATHRNGKRGAVKMLHAELSSDGDARRRFLQEGYVANAVGHPGAVSVLDDDMAEDGSVFLVMELLEGETVADRASKREGERLPVGEVIEIADQLLDVLVAAHAKGIVHRDLKPENVFLTTEGRAKVLDFGLAKLHAVASAGRATKTGTTIGTPAFLPPEQALGEWNRVDARTDLWAIGATMFTLVTGRLVHETDTVNKLMLAAMTKPAPRFADVWPGVNPELAAVVDRALRFEPNERWSSALEMQQALRRARAAMPIEIAGHAGFARDPSAIPARARRSVDVSASRSVLTSDGAPARRTAAWIAVSVLALAGIVAGIFALRARPTRIDPSSGATVDVVLGASSVPSIAVEPVANPPPTSSAAVEASASSAERASEPKAGSSSAPPLHPPVRGAPNSTRPSADPFRSW